MGLLFAAGPGRSMSTPKPRQSSEHSIMPSVARSRPPVRASGGRTGLLRDHDARGIAVRSSNNVYESAFVQTPTPPAPPNVGSCASIRFVPSQYTST